MKISILTLFPEMFQLFNHSIIGRGIKNNLINLEILNIRDYSLNKHKKVDDYPYGGGYGMVMTPQPVVDCIKAARDANNGKVIFLGPRGERFTQDKAKELSKEDNLIFLCGHYEGIDERIYDYVDEEISLGDFVLTGGEMACIPIVDSICRLIPGVLSTSDCYEEESFYNGLLEYPQYTRPPEYDNKKVPEVLLSGNHEKIRQWRKAKSLYITKRKRPDLYNNYQLTKEDIKILKKVPENE